MRRDFFQCDERKADSWQRGKKISGINGRRCVKNGTRSLAESKGSDHSDIR